MDIPSIVRVITIVVGGMAFGAAGGMALRAWLQRGKEPWIGTWLAACGSMVGIIFAEGILIERIGYTYLTWETPTALLCFTLVLIGRWLSAQGK